MDKKISGGLIASGLIISSVIGFYVIPFILQSDTASQGNLNSLVTFGVILRRPTTPEKWAFIVASSHTFYETDITDNVTDNPNFDNDPKPGWSFKTVTANPTGFWDKIEGKNDTYEPDPGCLNITTIEAGEGFWEYRFNDFNSLYPNMGYTLTLYAKWNGPIDSCAYIGIKWMDNVDSPTQTLWSGIKTNSSITDWTKISIHTQAPGFACSSGGGFNITLGWNQTLTGFSGYAKFDMIRMNLTENIDNPSGKSGNFAADGFAAQAIQAYWALKNHSYDDDHIFLMINAGDTDVRVWNPTINDYTYTAPFIDVNGIDVNKSRFMKELNASKPDSWARNINSRDEILIYLIDHGSITADSSGNATFHFEADGSSIKENDMNDLLNTINCSKTILMVDMCFAGNFITPILSSRSDIFLIASSTPTKFSWYWISATNAHYAGSFFFHPFWERLNTTGSTLNNAFNQGANHIPFNHIQPVFKIQGPMGSPITYIDKLGIFNTWTL